MKVKWPRAMTAAFVVVLILAVALAVILTVVLTNKKSNNTPTNGVELSVLSISIYVGKDTAQPAAPALRFKRQTDQNCAFDTVKTQAKEIVDKNLDDSTKYRIITFTDQVMNGAGIMDRATASQYINSLSSIPADDKFRQMAVIEKYNSSLREATTNDLLHFVPCKGLGDDYEKSDDFTNFNKAIANIITSNTTDSKKIMVVSPYYNGTQMDNTYGAAVRQSTNNSASFTTLGADQNITDTVVNDIAPTTVAPPLTTTSATTTESTTMSRGSTAPTTSEGSTTTVGSSSSIVTTVPPSSSPSTTGTFGSTPGVTSTSGKEA